MLDPKLDDKNVLFTSWLILILLMNPSPCVCPLFVISIPPLLPCDPLSLYGALQFVVQPWLANDSLCGLSSTKWVRSLPPGFVNAAWDCTPWSNLCCVLVMLASSRRQVSSSNPSYSFICVYWSRWMSCTSSSSSCLASSSSSWIWVSYKSLYLL